jgi:ankyrin repeat protein
MKDKVNTAAVKSKDNNVAPKRRVGDKRIVLTLKKAIEQRSLATVERLISQGVSPNAKCDESPLLISAVIANHIGIIKCLLNAGATVDSRNDLGETPLFAARSRESAILLIRWGADVNARSHYFGTTPVFVAAGNGRIKVLKLLIEHGAMYNLRDNEGDTPLIAAIKTNKVEAVRVLTEAGADVNLRDKDGEIPLGWAVIGERKSNRQIVEILVAAGVDLEARVANGLTPLMGACRHSSPEIVKLLLKAGADVNATSRDNLTPLICAALMNKLDTVRLLLKAGANPDVRVARHSRNPRLSGKAAKEIAEVHGHKKVAELLCRTSAGDN